MRSRRKTGYGARVLNVWFERSLRWYLRRRGVVCRVVPTSKGRVHLLDSPGRGALPPIMLLHGISSSSAPYANLLLRLRQHHRRVLAPDSLGHGASDEPADADPDTLLAGMLETFDQVVDEPVFLYGNSLGGAAAIRLALLRPEKVRGLIACSPGGAQLSSDELGAFLGRFSFNQRQDAARFVRSLYGRPPAYAPLIAGEVRRVFRRPFLQELLRRIKPEHLFGPAEIAALTVPTLLIWGQKDTLMMPEMLRFFRQYLPAHAEVEEPEEFGHCPHLDRPSHLAARILSFTRKVTDG